MNKVINRGDLKMRTNKFLLVIFAMSIFLWQCGENPVGAGMENEVEIEIFNGQFNPSSITIQTGTRVVWVNKDSETHSVYPGTFMNGTDDFLAVAFGEGQLNGGGTGGDDDAIHMVLREPLGVVGCISPWNYPLLMETWMSAWFDCRSLPASALARATG